MEDEWDKILREQDEFLNGNVRPSAKVVKNNTDKPRRPSEPATAAAAAAAPAPPPAIIGKIVERMEGLVLQPMKVGPSTGFPQPKKQSVFKSKLLKQPTKRGAAPTSCTTFRDQSMEDENNTKINNMSLADIQQAQAELQAALSPKLLARFKCKPAAAAVEVVQEEQAPVSSNIPLQEIESEDQLVDELHKLKDGEALKVQWMSDVQEETTSSSAIRIDFDGHILTGGTSNSSAHSSGLYHHGQNPTEPGYTMEELVLLSQSSVPSQRASALRVMGNALANDLQLYRNETIARVLCHSLLTDSYRSSRPNALRALSYLVAIEFDDSETFENYLGHRSRIRSVLPFNNIPAAEMLPFLISIQAYGILRALSVHSADFCTSDVVCQPTCIDYLRCIRTMCQSSRTMAENCVSNGTVESIFGVLALSDVEPAIQIEALRVWRVCLAYSLTIQAFTYLYPLLLGFQLQCKTLAPVSDAKQQAIYAALNQLLQVDTRYLNEMQELIEFIPKTSGPGLHLLATYCSYKGSRPTTVPASSPSDSLNVQVAKARLGLSVLVQDVAQIAAKPSRLQVYLDYFILKAQPQRKEIACKLMHTICTGDEHLFPFVLKQLFPADDALYQLYIQLIEISSTTSPLDDSLFMEALPESGTTALPLLDCDWMYFPFSRMDFKSSMEREVMLRHVLAFIQTIDNGDDDVPPARAVFHLIQILFENIEFDLMDGLYAILDAHMQQLKPGELLSVFQEKMDCVEFIEAFMTQFAGSSFGNKTFACCVALFLQMEFPVAVRKCIWKTPGIAHLLQTFPSTLQACLTPIESDLEIAYKFVEIVTSTRIQRDSFAYIVASHHIQHILTQQNWIQQQVQLKLDEH